MTTPDPVLASKVARAELWKRVVIVVTAAMVAVVLGLLLVLIGQVSDVIGQVRATQLEGTPTGRKLVSSADRILDCTDPEGDCYKENQKNTAALLGTVQRIIVLAAACAVDVTPAQSVEQREDAITLCITKQFAAEQPAS